MSETFDPYYKWLGIAPEDQPPTLYGLLGLRQFEDDPDVIEACGDQRMVHLRAYQTGAHSAESQKLLNEVAKAKITLLNPQKKAEYDKQLREQLGRFVEVVETEKPVEATSKKSQPRTLLIGGAVAAGLVLLAVIVVSATKRDGPDEQSQPVAVAPLDRQEPKPSLPPQPAPAELAEKVPDESGTSTEPEPKPPTPEVAPEEESPVEPPPAATEPAPPATETAMPEPADEPETEPVADQKLPVPSSAEQQTMVEQFSEVYELSKKRTAEEEIALARQLFKASEESKGNPVEKFVYFLTAMKAACAGGDPALMLEIVDAMGEEFEVDTLAGKQKMLATFISGKPDAKRIGAFVEAADPVIDEAIDAGRHDVAMSLAEATYGLTRRAGDRDLRKRMFDRRNEVRKLANEFNELADVRAALKTNPDDPAANLAMGRWLYSQRGDWEQALPHLAKSSSSAMKSLASEELNSPPTEPANKIRLADAWWALSEKVEGKEREALQLHAGQWYEQAAEELPKGLAKEKIARRLADIAKIDQSAPKKPRKTKRPEMSKELAIDLSDKVKMEFVLIPAGELLMGSSDAERKQAMEQAKASKMRLGKLVISAIPTEGPQHRVKITRPFYLGKYEVTQSQWETVMGNNPSEFKAPSNPLENVSWNDFQPFLAKLNMEFKKKGMLFGLPTEAGWEYACRAGTTTAYCFGDDPTMLAQYGWFKGNARRSTHAVGQKKPNAWGLYDMHGSVWEWCADWYAEAFYAYSPPVDPVGPQTGSKRVLRGGSRTSTMWFCRSTYRYQPPRSRSRNRGFRLALVLTAK